MAPNDEAILWYGLRTIPIVIFFSLLLLDDDRKVALAKVDLGVFELSIHRNYMGTLSALSKYVRQYIKVGMSGDKLGCPISEICVILKRVLSYVTSMVIFSHSMIHVRPAAGPRLLEWALSQQHEERSGGGLGPEPAGWMSVVSLRQRKYKHNH